MSPASSTNTGHHRSYYCVPRWCRMDASDHFDGMGGCWGISYGCVEEHGRDYCRLCVFYRRNAERVPPDVAMGFLARKAVSA